MKISDILWLFRVQKITWKTMSVSVLKQKQNFLYDINFNHFYLYFFFQLEAPVNEARMTVQTTGLNIAIRTTHIMTGNFGSRRPVIAVPIAGGFILVLLVLLAVRMLRNDSRRHTQLMQMRRHRDVIAKAQLYVADHFCDKNDHHLCFNSLEKPTRTNVNSVYKDVNVKLDIDGNGYEKLNSSFSEGKCHSNPAHVLSTAGSPASHSCATSDNSTKSSTTLHTSSTQTPDFCDSLVGDSVVRKQCCNDFSKANGPTCDSVIVWGQSQKRKNTLGDVV